MPTITLPLETKFDFGQIFIQALQTIQQINLINAGESIEINYSENKFLGPLFTLPTCVYLQSIQSRYTIEFNSGNPSQNVRFSSYAETLNYREYGAKPENYLSVTDFSDYLKGFLNKNYLPIINFPASRDAINTKIRDNCLSIVNKILVQQCNVTGNMHTAIMYLVDEAVNNIVDHSHAERGFITAQYFPKAAFLDIVIAETGIGIMQSYINNQVQCTSHADGLRYALSGVSTKDRPEAEGRGFGISTSRRMLQEGIGGLHLICSGNALIINDKMGIIILPSGLYWPGSVVGLRIPLQPKNPFNPSDYYE